MILTDVDEDTFADGEARRVLYVAASRARHYLDIAAVLDDRQINAVCERLIERQSKNAKMLIGSCLKVKITV